MTTSARPLVRLTSPGEIAARSPPVRLRAGESLVVLSLRGPRARLGLTMRFDLPAPEGEHALAGEARGPARRDGAARTVAVLLTAAPGDRPRPGADRRVPGVVSTRGVRVDDVLLVVREVVVARLLRPRVLSGRGHPPAVAPRGRRPWGSWRRTRRSTAARSGLTGCARRLGGPACAARGARGARGARPGGAERVRARTATGRRAANDDVLERWRTAVARHACPPTELTDDEAAELAVSLEDVLVRDAVVGWALREPAGVLGRAAHPGAAHAPAVRRAGVHRAGVGGLHAGRGRAGQRRARPRAHQPPWLPAGPAAALGPGRPGAAGAGAGGPAVERWAAPGEPAQRCFRWFTRSASTKKLMRCSPSERKG
jgi:hypothetical protein